MRIAGLSHAAGPFDRLMQPPVETVLLWQVAGEFLNQLRKWEFKGQLTATEVEAAFQRFRNMFSLRASGSLEVGRVNGAMQRDQRSGQVIGKACAWATLISFLTWLRSRRQVQPNRAWS